MQNERMTATMIFWRELNIPHICHIYHIWHMWRKICHVEKFQISMHVEKSEISLHLKNFQNFSTWPMWRNLKFLHIWHECDVENVSTNVQYMLFCCKISFVAINAVLSQYTHFCVEKILTKNCVCGENMTNMRYGIETLVSPPNCYFVSISWNTGTFFCIFE